jgi:TetR/AcrR family transcriptional regulator, fatty acid biosynthesis regulator
LRVNPEKKEEKERVTQALLRVTLRLAATHGFVSLGLREVSRAADIAPTSFYRHFADMEELGLALIEELGGRFVGSWTEPDGAAPAGPERTFAVIAARALAAVSEDPELLRFILAERVGAIPSFRAAIYEKLSVVRGAIREGFVGELAVDPVKARAPLSDAADAATTLLLEACGQALDRGGEHVPALREQLLRQIRVLLAGAAAVGALS